MMKYLIVSLLATAASTTAAQATVLNFNGNICAGLVACGNGARIDQTYGDNADIDVFYEQDTTTTLSAGDNSSSLFFWNRAYNELVNVAYGGQSDTKGVPMILFTPLGGKSVTLNSFRLGAWPNTSRTTQYTVIDGDGATLFSSGQITVGTGDVSSLFAVNITSANGIGIQWGPDGFNVGIDDIDFTVGAGAVPEPQTWMLLLAGFGIVGGAMRARRGKVSFG
jgi:hypothetical protein